MRYHGSPTDFIPQTSIRNTKMKTTPAIWTESPTTEILKGNWHIIKGRLRQKYAHLTDNDLRYAQGQEEELIGRLQKLTGQTREEIEMILRDLAGRP